MIKLVVLILSFAFVGCQSQLSSMQTSSETVKDSSSAQETVQKYAENLIPLENSDNYFVKDVILYRINDAGDTNLAFIYSSTENHIKAVTVNCAVQEAEEIGYYEMNEITEKILEGYLPPKDPGAVPVMHDAPLPLSIAAQDYVFACQ